MLTIVFLLGAGLALLLSGAEWLVRGGGRLAFYLGISPLVIGLTVVAFGTSAPELATSVFAAYHGRGDIALGNVVGSNIVNIGLVLGLAGLLVPIRVDTTLNTRLIPFLLLISLMLWVFALGLQISRVQGLVLLLLFGLYIWYCLKTVRPDAGKLPAPAVHRGESEVRAEEGGRLSAGGRAGPLVKSLFLVVAGLVMLGAGAELFVRGAVEFAHQVGVSEAVVGVTVVALGTSLPELVASVMAAAKRLPSMALGNIVGSNIFNILCIIGVSAGAFPFAVSPSLVNFSLPTMVGFTVLLMVICFTRKRVSRAEAGVSILFTAMYAAGLLRFS